MGTALDEWAAILCADETKAGQYPEICEEGAVLDTCDDTVAEALEETSEDTGTNLDCSVACGCQFVEDSDAEALDACTAACEEAEATLESECKIYYDALLAAGTIDADEYYDELVNTCGEDIFEDWFLNMQDLSRLVDSYSVYNDETTTDWINSNDSGGAENSAEVRSRAEDFENTVIAGIALNAYDDNFNGVGKINVECVWLAWREIINGEIQPAESNMFSMTSGDTATEGCDGDFETGGPGSETDFSESNSFIASIALDGEDCGIEMATYRKPLLEKYDPEAAAFLGKEDISYYLHDQDDGEASGIGSGWCQKAVATEEVIATAIAAGVIATTSVVGGALIVAASTILVDWGTDTECSNFNDEPDIEITELLNKDAFIVGIGIQAAKDGKRCGINIFTQTLELTMNEGAVSPWEADDEDAAEE
jgi:hypothetical protein